MGKEISLIAFLDEVVSRNTQHYKSDFELDAQKLRDALDSPNQDERVFYFMSRPNGTWCVLERDAFLRESDGYKIWTHYANMPAGIEAYRIVITGQCGTAPMGYVVKLNYREQTSPLRMWNCPSIPVRKSGYRWSNTADIGKKSSLSTARSRISATARKVKRSCTVSSRWNTVCKKAGGPK